MTNADKPWEIYTENYKDKWVRISVDGQTRIGILKSADYNLITLRPSVISETLILANDALELRLETETPMIISMPIRTIEPISEEFVKKFMEKYPIKWNDNQLSLF
jgi:hypothetical protein